MKVNGVKHVGVAPYNVASNGMGVLQELHEGLQG